MQKFIPSDLDRKNLLLTAILLLAAFFFSIYAFLACFAAAAYLLYKSYKAPEAQRRYRKLLYLILTFCLPILIVIASLELYLHLAEPEFLQLNYSITGNFSDFAGRGYLDKGAFQKQEGTFRILGLGDSFARNLTWEKHNYLDFLQADYTRAEACRAEVVNAGMEGIGPGYYWHILKTYGDDFKPDLVLVGFFVGNDFMEMQFRTALHSIYNLKEPVDPLPRFFSYLQFKNWWLYQFAARRFTLIRERSRLRQESRKQPRPPQDREKDQGTFSEETFLTIERERLAIFEKAGRERLDRIFARDAGVFRKMKQWCDSRGVGLVVVIFPDQVQVEPELLDRVLKKFNLGKDSIDTGYPNKLLSQYCKRWQIQHLDLLEAFQKAATSQKLYRLRDTHWNEAGNRLAAGIIFEFLQSNGLIRKN